MEEASGTCQSGGKHKRQDDCRIFFHVSLAAVCRPVAAACRRARGGRPRDVPVLNTDAQRHGSPGRAPAVLSRCARSAGGFAENHRAKKILASKNRTRQTVLGLKRGVRPDGGRPRRRPSCVLHAETRCKGLRPICRRLNTRFGRACEISTTTKNSKNFRQKFAAKPRGEIISAHTSVASAPGTMAPLRVRVDYWLVWLLAWPMARRRARREEGRRPFLPFCIAAQCVCRFGP